MADGKQRKAGRDQSATAVAAALQAGMRHHQSGALEQADALYRQVLAHDPGNADALHLLGVTCSQRGRHDEAVELIGRAVALLPPSAAMHINLGNALLGTRRHDEAVANYRTALALKPGNATAHRNLGSALNALKRHAEAAESYRMALAIRPDYAEAYNGLGLTLIELERNEEAVACFERARTLQPNYAEAHNNLGGALRNLNRYEEALPSIERALSLQPDHADSHWYRALVRLALGDFRGGWADYEWRWRAAVDSHPREFPQPLWLGQESLAGRTILLHSEQGLGDTLQFVRYAPLVAQSDARVLLLVQPPLKRLLAGMEGVTAVYTAVEALPRFDCHCPLMSLPHAFGTELATVPAAIPYVHADPAAAARWRERLGEGSAKVGLVWAGSAREHDPREHRVDQRRSMTLAQFAPLAGVAGVRFVSLQKGPPSQQAHEPPPGMNLADFTAELQDFADTAALVAQLDLVITVDTSVAHLAGAMGKPVWILSRFDGCWRWLLDREDSPWYPTARLFRQPASGDWDSVIARVAQALADWSRGSDATPVAATTPQRKSDAGPVTLLLPQTVQLAAAAFQSGDWTEAERQCRLILRVDADNYEALSLLGIVTAQTRRTQEAVGLLSRAVAVCPNLAEAHSNLGKVLYSLSRPGEALECYDRALNIKPDYVDVLNNRGVALCDLKRPEEALECYDRALRIEPDYAEALNNRGVALRELNRHADALECYDRALRIKPDYAEALNNRGGALYGLNRHVEALECYDRALTIKPDDAKTLNNRGVALCDLNRHEEALECYDLALRVKPGYAEALNNRGVALRELNRHAEALECYDRALRIRPDDAKTLNNRGGALYDLNRPEQALECYDRALTIKPDDAKTLNNRGIALCELKRYEQALECYDRALRIKPDDVEALNNRGVALRELNRHEQALECYDRALRIKPDYAEALSNRGSALYDLNRPDQALECYDRALRIKPDDAKTLSNRGVALCDLNRHGQALESYEHALGIKPDYASAHWNLSLCLLRLGDFARGWREYEWRWQQAQLEKSKRELQQPWLGQEPLAGRTIVLHSEQGLGDTLQFVRYAPLVAQSGARVLLLVEPPLKRLLAGVEGVAAVYTALGDLPRFDYHCPLMSLPLAFGTELATIPAAIPYVHADPAATARWRERLGEGSAKVGLVWAGSAREHDPSAHRVDQRRSMTLAQFAPLAGVAGVRFVSLQKGPPSQQAREPPPGMNLTDLTAELDDFADTAALVAELDLVITVDTSVAHLAGAMGKPVWILSRFDGCWRWLLEREDSPWYPTARLFRQPASGDWDSVIARVAQALADWSCGFDARPVS